MSCFVQGIFLLQKNVSVIANYIQIVLCYSSIIKGNVIPKTKKGNGGFYNEKKNGICTSLRDNGSWYGSSSGSDSTGS